MIDWGVIVSTLIGPVLAVQAQKAIERSREKKEKQLRIFHILMATRAIRGNSAEHTQALNSIDLFFNKKIKKEKPIVDAWNIYFDHLHDLSENALLEEISRWNEQSGKLLVELLGKFSTYFGYDFDYVQLKRGVYFPRVQSEELAEQAALRGSLIKVLRGDQSIKMAISSLPDTSRVGTAE